MFRNKDIGIIADKKLFIFDIDGTVCLSDEPTPGAVEFTDRLRADGKRILFFTNNSSCTDEFFLARLRRAGFDVGPGEILTSADVAARFLLDRRAGASVFAVLPPQVTRSLADRGVDISDGSSARADIVLSGFDTSLTYDKLKTACRYLSFGAEFFSTHRDLSCPTADGMVPDSGAVCAFLTAATGRTPVYLGKPDSVSAQMIRSLSGLDWHDMCMFGDRLYTDIAFGNRHGMATVLLLTGEAAQKDAERADTLLRPDFVFKDFSELCRLMYDKRA